MSRRNRLETSARKQMRAARPTSVQWELLESRQLLSAIPGPAHVRHVAPARAVTQTIVPIQGSGNTIAATAGQAFFKQVGVISGLSRRSLRANINWGDGTEVTRGSFSVDAGGNLHISGGHVYSTDGTFKITVRLRRGGKRGPIVGQFTAAADVVGGTVTLQPAAGQPFTATIGSFFPRAGGLDMPNALIRWGDGEFSQGTLTSNAQGGLDVVGTHTYARPGIYRVTGFVTQGNEFNVSNVATLSSFADVGEITPAIGNHPSAFQSLLPPGM